MDPTLITAAVQEEFRRHQWDTFVDDPPAMHGGAEGGPVTKELAEYVLAISTSQIVLLADLSIASEPDVSF
jgi:hypothetical protein